MRASIGESSILKIEDPRFIGEIKIDSSYEFAQLKELEEKYPDVTFVLMVTPDNIDELKPKLIEYKGSSLKFKIGFTGYRHAEGSIKFFQELGVPFYLMREQICSMDEFVSFCDLGVSDVIISGSLAFQMERLGHMARIKNVKLRMIPDVAQYDFASFHHVSYNEERCLTSFWVRPEDLMDYAPYISMIDFIDPEKEAVSYDVYFIDREWVGQLKYLIRGFEHELNSKFVPKDIGFGKERLNCERKCLHYACHNCSRVYVIATLTEAEFNKHLEGAR